MVKPASAVISEHLPLHASPSASGQPGSDWVAWTCQAAWPKSPAKVGVIATGFKVNMRR